MNAYFCVKAKGGLACRRFRGPVGEETTRMTFVLGLTIGRPKAMLAGQL
jgi:hypothetical protein